MMKLKWEKFQAFEETTTLVHGLKLTINRIDDSQQYTANVFGSKLITKFNSANEAKEAAEDVAENLLRRAIKRFE